MHTFPLPSMDFAGHKRAAATAPHASNITIKYLLPLNLLPLNICNSLLVFSGRGGGEVVLGGGVRLLHGIRIHDSGLISNR